MRKPNLIALCTVLFALILGSCDLYQVSGSDKHLKRDIVVTKNANSSISFTLTITNTSPFYTI